MLHIHKEHNNLSMKHIMERLTKALRFAGCAVRLLVPFLGHSPQFFLGLPSTLPSHTLYRFACSASGSPLFRYRDPTAVRSSMSPLPSNRIFCASVDFEISIARCTESLFLDESESILSQALLEGCLHDKRVIQRCYVNSRRLNS